MSQLSSERCLLLFLKFEAQLIFFVTGIFTILDLLKYANDIQGDPILIHSVLRVQYSIPQTTVYVVRVNRSEGFLSFLS